MSALPKQVQKQLREVEELEKQMQAPAPSGQTAENPPQPQPGPEPATPSATEPPAPPAPQEPQEDWHHKYLRLQGKYDAEVPRLHQQNKELSQQLSQLQIQIEALKPVPKAEPQDSPLVTDKDRESFGADLIDVTERVARQVMREHVKPLQEELAKRDARIAQLEAQLQKTGGDVATVTFEQRLAMAVPDFPKVNADPKWFAFLDEIDPLTGEPRRVHAEKVYAMGNVDAVKRVVDLFKSTLEPEPARDPRQTELNHQVQPGRSAAGTAAPSAPKRYTEAEAAAAFERVRKLNMAGKHDEAAKLEAELSLAYMQGRVHP